MTYTERYQGNEQSENINRNSIDKKELEKLGIEVQLSQLEKGVIEEFINKLDKKYQEFLEGKDDEEKKGVVLLLKDAEKILGKETYEKLISSGIPPKEFLLFVYELIKIEQEKELLETATMILTQDEIKELKKLLLTKNFTQKQLRRFIEEQLNENISSAELIKGTSFEKKLKESGKNPYETMRQINEVGFNILNIDYISEDTIYNMSTGLIYSIVSAYNKGLIKTPFNKMLNIFLNKEGEINKNDLNYIKNLFSSIDKIKQATKELNLNKETSENNNILMNPKLFGEFINKIIKNNLSTEEIKKELVKEQEKSHSKTNKKEIIEKLKSDFEQVGNRISSEEIQSVGKIGEIGKTIKEIKEKGKGIQEQVKGYLELNGDEILDIKTNLEEIGIWKYIKDIISSILKLLGYKQGWNSLEKKISEKKFKDIIKYFEEKFQSIDENSIFYETIIKDKQVNEIRTKNSLSYESLEYLDKISGENKKEKLDYFFESKNFKEVLKEENISLKEFSKNIVEYKIEKTKDGKELKVAYIDLAYLSNIIEKRAEKERTSILKEISDKTQVPQDVIYAIWKNESNLSPIGEFITRFEKHKYEKFIKEGKKEKEAKMLATSYGAFQIMGFNYKLAGYNSLEEFVESQKTRNGQIEAFVNFINHPSNTQLKIAMQKKEFQQIAKLYNGPAYKKNLYDTKLAQAVDNFNNNLA